MASRKLNDGWFRFFGIPVIALMGNIIFFNRNESGDQRFGFGIIFRHSLVVNQYNNVATNSSVFLYDLWQIKTASSS
ncbi:MAG TPA: hypothetical protein VFW07_11750 [Parafilimonas sp.]|nr:hypothetical protein [Parafilimonas sp.]